MNPVIKDLVEKKRHLFSSKNAFFHFLKKRVFWSSYQGKLLATIPTMQHIPCRQVGCCRTPNLKSMERVTEGAKGSSETMKDCVIINFINAITTPHSTSINKCVKRFQQPKEFLRERWKLLIAAQCFLTPLPTGTKTGSASLH